MTTPMMFDIFISYASDQEAVVRKCLYEPLLRCKTDDAKRPRIFFDKTQLQVGESWQQGLERGIKNSKRFLLVVTKEYFAPGRQGTGAEFQAIYGQDMAGNRRVIIALLLDPEAEGLMPTMFRSNIQYLNPHRYPDDWFERLCGDLELQNINGLNPPLPFGPAPAPGPSQAPAPARSAPVPVPAIERLLDEAFGTGGRPEVRGFFSSGLEQAGWEKIKEPLTQLAQKKDVTEPQLAEQAEALGPGSGPEALLVLGRCEPAVAAAAGRLRTEMSFRNLRLVALANLAVAARGSDPSAAARAGACLAVLEHTPELWTQWPGGKEARRSVMDAAFEVLGRLAAVPAAAPADEELTGGLALPDFIAAERATAQQLEKIGGGILTLAYGYGFAREYGRTARLAERANEFARISETLSFTPLFGCAFLEQQGRYAEVLERPPRWLGLPQSPWYAESIRLVARCALRVLETGLHLDRLPETHAACTLAVERLTAARQAPGPDGPLDRTVARILDAAAHEAQAAELKNDWAVRELDALTARLAAALGGETTEARRRLAGVLARHRVRFAASLQNWEEVVRQLGEAEAAAALTPAELATLFRAWYNLAYIPAQHAQAVAAAQQTVERLRAAAPDWPELPAMQAALEKIKTLRLAPDDLQEAKKAYAEKPNPSTLIRLLQAVRRQAGEVMAAGEGPRGVIRLFEELGQQFPALGFPHKGSLRDSLLDLCATWKREGRFSEEDVESLHDLSQDLIRRTADPVTPPLPVPPAGDPFALARAAYHQNPKSPKGRTEFLIQIKRRAAVLFQHQGAATAADLIRALRAEFPGFVELTQIPSQLADDLRARNYPEEQIGQFLNACRKPAPPPRVEVPEPRAVVPADKLLVPRKDDSARRWEEYERATRPGALTEDLRFSAVAPPLVPGRPQFIAVAAHGPDVATATLAELAARLNESETPAAAGASPTVHLMVNGLQIKEAERPLTWVNGVGIVRIPVQAVGPVPAGGLAGLATVYVAGLEIARLDLRLPGGAAEGSLAPVASPTRRYQRAYGCYAPDNQGEVGELMRQVRAQVPGWGEFVCGDHLRASHDWQKRLKDAIGACDVFYLFWSEAARGSDWVRWDLRCALDQGRAAHWIVPVPLASPDAVPPPEELLAQRPLAEWLAAYHRVRSGPGGGVEPPRRKP